MAALQKNVIGIVGGLGPDATIYMYRRLVEKSLCNRENFTFPHVVIACVPITSAQLWALENQPEDEGDAVTTLVGDALERLSRAGATVIGIPCNTVHLLEPRYQPRCSSTVKLLSIVECTVRAIQSGFYVKTVCVLGTNSTVYGGLYSARLKERGIETILPARDDQKRVMEMINGVLTGASRPEAYTKELAGIIEEIPCQVVVLACTELPLIVGQSDCMRSGQRLISTLDALLEGLVGYLTSDK